jgi:hypothetical protein
MFPKAVIKFVKDFDFILASFTTDNVQLFKNFTTEYINNYTISGQNIKILFYSIEYHYELNYVTTVIKN